MRGFRRIDRSVATRSSVSPQRVVLLTVIDQGASSVSNFALAFVVAHYSKANALGVFAILTTTFIISQGLVRSISSDCLLTRSESDPELMATYERGGYLAAIVASCSLAALLAAVSGFLPHAFVVPFVIFAVSFPLMACQDYTRFIGISRYDPGYSIRLDVVWVVLFVAAYIGLRHTGHTSLPWLFGAWSGAGALVGLYTLRAHLARRGKRELLVKWDKSERPVGLRFAGQFLLVTSWAYLISYLLLIVLSLSDIGLFKLSQLALGPITVMAAGVQASFVALAAKRFQADTGKALRFIFLGGLGIGLMTGAWAALVYFAPVHAMTTALGPAWPAARKIIPFGGMAFALGSFAGAATSGLRAMRAARENLRLALVLVPFQFILVMGGAKYYGVRGAAGGLALANVINVLLSWGLLLRVARHYDPTRETTTHDVLEELIEP